MKYSSRFLLAGIVFLVSLSSCNNTRESKTVTEVPEVKEISPDPESQLLFDYLVEMGDYVNSRQFPSMIKAPTLFESLGENTLVIDLRDKDTFDKGHIEGAVNVNFSDIPSYFENDIQAFKYDKIVIACYHGQMSSYTTALLRLMGYGNVYSLRWGMSIWNKDIYDLHPWGKAVVNLESKLQTADNEKAVPVSFPGLRTGLSTGEDILMARAKFLFDKGFGSFKISPEDAIDENSDYYIINYDRRDKYESGHLPGAVRYKPNGTLGIISEMSTIPPDQPVAVYCGTGHSSSFVTAYLDLFGYDAYTIVFGNNIFMRDKMLKEESELSWQVFKEDMVYDYPYVK